MSPLTWSQAAYVMAVEEYLDRARRLSACARPAASRSAAARPAATGRRRERHPPAAAGHRGSGRPAPAWSRSGWPPPSRRTSGSTAAAPWPSRAGTRRGPSTSGSPREPLARRIHWADLDVFFGDERAVPPDDPASNYLMAATALLSRVPIPAAQVHRHGGGTGRPGRGGARVRPAAARPARPAAARHGGRRAHGVALPGIGRAGRAGPARPPGDRARPSPRSA